MSEDLPAILEGVDLLAILGVEVVEGADISEIKRGLRRTFLKRAKECHPDKQKSTTGGSDSSLAFARLKAAFDYLQADGVFNTLYNRALHQRRAEKARKERAHGIAAKQSAHLDALLRREQAAAAAAAAARRGPPGTDSTSDSARSRTYTPTYDDIFEASATSTVDTSSCQGILYVAARTMKIANESEVNCLLLSDHFSKMFSHFGLVKVEPIDIEDAGVDAVNVKIGILTFESHEHALKALLHYRNNRASFRCDLYALALGPQSGPAKPAATGDYPDSLDEMETTVLRRLRQAAEKRRKVAS
ncbi:cell cycle control protein, putative [Babesia ovis]|uniref:Cell cycle control protein, putative n=1 Tax=Babesia ovis TaxID=5869 RepID=A0A9W5T9T6_BABOV|nr:cell cycle control protein, putative [Babesia ovis]